MRYTTRTLNINELVTIKSGLHLLQKELVTLLKDNIDETKFGIERRMLIRTENILKELDSNDTEIVFKKGVFSPKIYRHL